MEEKNQSNWQISKITTNKKLIETVDKLKPSNEYNYAKLHAGNGEISESGNKMTSLIGINIADYSKGTGENFKIVTFNLRASEINELYLKAKAEAERAKYFLNSDIYLSSQLDLLNQKLNFMLRMLNSVLPNKLSAENLSQFLTKTNPLPSPEYIFQKEKIIGVVKNEQGLSPVNKIFIKRSVYDTSNNLLGRPWYIKIEEGTGIAETTNTGGTKIKGGSYSLSRYCFINLTDEEFQQLLLDTSKFIDKFEIASSFSKIKKIKTYQYSNGENNENI